MENTNEVDRISSLPDPIIHHVFSFLDMQLVIKTSTLSRRWKDLWTSSPYLNFELPRESNDTDTDTDTLLQDEKLNWFLSFVDRALICHDTFTIHIFRITSGSPLDIGRLLTWLIGVSRRNVKELYLEFHFDQPFELPPGVFPSNITALTLTDNSGDAVIHLPTRICSAPRLSILKLEYVRLPESNAEGVLELSCPVLEKLYMLSCDDSHLKLFTVSATQLTHLEFAKEHYCDESSCKINICSPNLVSLLCFGSGYLDFTTVNLPALVSADVNMSRYDETDTEVHLKLLIKVLKGVYKAQILKLSALNLKDIADSPDTLKMLPDLFMNLREIIIVDGGMEGEGMASICAMANMLKKLPCTQSFVWDRSKYHYEDSHGEDIEIQGKFHSLKMFKIRNPQGVEDEFKFVKFLVESGNCLMKVLIYPTACSSKSPTEFVSKFNEMKFPNGSRLILQKLPD